MRILILLLLVGCATDSLTPEQRMKLEEKLIDARLQDGSDETCYTVMGIEVFCRKRERDIDRPDDKEN